MTRDLFDNFPEPDKPKENEFVEVVKEDEGDNGDESVLARLPVSLYTTVPEAKPEEIVPFPTDIPQASAEPEEDFLDKLAGYGNLVAAQFKNQYAPWRWRFAKLANTLFGKPAEPDFVVLPEDVIGYEDFPWILQARNREEFWAYRDLADQIRSEEAEIAKHGSLARISSGFIAGLGDVVSVASGIIGAGVVTKAFRVFKIEKKAGKLVKAGASGAAAGAIDIPAHNVIADKETTGEEYVIGVSSAGLLGCVFSVAGDAWRTLNLKERKAVREGIKKYQEKLTEPIRIDGSEVHSSVKPETASVPETSVSTSPVSVDTSASPTSNGGAETQAVSVAVDTGASDAVGRTKPAGAFGLEKVGQYSSPNLTLANSRFKTAREFGQKTSPQPFRMVDEAGNTIAQGTDVETLSTKDIAKRMHIFDRFVQNRFKNWMETECGYGWAKATFKNWSNFNIWEGSEWEKFCDQTILKFEFPDMPCANQVREVFGFFKDQTADITDMAVKAGVFNENFEALRKIWETERRELREHTDRYNQAVADTDAVDALRGEVLSDVYTKSEQLRKEVETIEGKVARVDALLKNNKTTLSEVRAEIRKNETSAERANKSILLETGRQKGISETERFASKVVSKHEDARAGLETIKEGAELTLRFQKDTLKLIRQERPLLNRARARLRTAVNENQKKLNSLYKGLIDEVEVFLKDAPEADRTLQEVLLTHSEAIKGILSKINTLDRVRRGKMTKSDRKKEFSRDIKPINDDIRQLREQIAENLAALKRANVELPPKITRYINTIEDQTAWTKRMKTELKTTERILGELRKIQNHSAERVVGSGGKLQKYYGHLDDTGKTIEKLMPRFMVRNRIKKTLTEAKERYLEQIAELKKDANELSKIHTQLRSLQKETLANREKPSREAPTKEQLDRFAYLEKRLADPKFTIADISNIKDPFYFPRIYDIAKITKRGGEFDRTLVEAYKAEGRNVSTAEEEKELWFSAFSTRRKILGVDEGRGHNIRGQRKMELSREVDIPTHYLNDFIEKDIRTLYARMLTTLVPDIYLSKAFGTVSFEQIANKLQSERNEALLRARGVPAEEQAIVDDFERSLKAMRTIWRRVRQEPLDEEDDIFKTLARGVKDVNVLTKLGRGALAILYDSYNMQLRVGLGRIGKTVFKRFFVPGVKKIREEMRDADIWMYAFDEASTQRWSELRDAVLGVKWYEKAERGLNIASRRFVSLTGMPAVDRFCKVHCGLAKAKYFLKYCSKIAEGRKVPDEVLSDMREFGIRNDMMRRIGEEFKLHGKILKGNYIPHADLWAPEVGDVFKSAVTRAQIFSVLTPTAGSVPEKLDKAFWGLWMQFKRCLFAAVSTVTVPTAQMLRDKRVAKVALALTAGYVGAVIKNICSSRLSGRKKDLDAVLSDAWKDMDVLSLGSFLLGASDFIDENKPDYMFGEKMVINAGGAGASFATDIANSVKGFANFLEGEKMTKVQKRATERLIPFNNFIFFQAVLSAIYGTDRNEAEKEKKRRKDKEIRFPKKTRSYGTSGGMRKDPERIYARDLLFN